MITATAHQSLAGSFVCVFPAFPSKSRRFTPVAFRPLLRRWRSCSSLPAEVGLTLNPGLRPLPQRLLPLRLPPLLRSPARRSLPAPLRRWPLRLLLLPGLLPRLYLRPVLRRRSQGPVPLLRCPARLLRRLTRLLRRPVPLRSLCRRPRSPLSRLARPGPLPWTGRLWRPFTMLSGVLPGTESRPGGLTLPLGSGLA